jgi:frataxin-like iron-binding protein CyaY
MVKAKGMEKTSKVMMNRNEAQQDLWLEDKRQQESERI